MKFFCRKTTHFGLLLAAVFIVLAGSGLAMAQDAPATTLTELEIGDRLHDQHIDHVPDGRTGPFYASWLCHA